MERIPLASRALLSAGYDAESQTLELEFSSGRVYRFDGVPAGTFEWLLRSPNKGGFVARMISDRFPSRDVTPPAPGVTPDLAQVLRASLERLGPRKP